MKVLFVSSCGKGGKPKEIIANQGSSLSSEGIELEYFCVSEKGLCGYLRAIPLLRKKIKESLPDIIHAHYSYSGFLAAMAGAKPLVVSLMGSDMQKRGPGKILPWILIRYFARLGIVKSEKMQHILGLDNTVIIPNGVDTDLFQEKDRNESHNRTNFDSDKINILFAGDPSREEKNFSLADASVRYGGSQSIKLIPLVDIPHSDMCWYYSAADMLLLTSKWEGSPNVVKEAMACNLPVISTDVGDVSDLINGVTNSYICEYDPGNISSIIQKIAGSKKRSDGRQKIFSMGLDSPSIAKRIIAEYKKLIDLS